MQIEWTVKALIDVERLHAFLSQYDRGAAGAMVLRLDAAPARLTANPRLGERVENFAPREVRKLSVGRYVLHYEIARDRIFILRVWHAREERS